jgi:hypothetical protein
MLYGIPVGNGKLPKDLPNWAEVKLLDDKHYVTHNNFHMLARLIGCQELNCSDVFGFKFNN